MKFQSIVDLFPPIPVVKSRSSITVPDMSFTPREIIQKFSRGERVPLGFQGLYDDENASAFEEDPTRDPMFDFGDYVEEKHALEERQKASKRRSSGKSAASAKREARREELSAGDAMSGETTSEQRSAASTAQD